MSITVALILLAGWIIAFALCSLIVFYLWDKLP
jgi:hypothetical protein